MSSEQSMNEFEDNGLILNNVYVPIELIQRIMYYVDDKTLLNCQLVCKLWNETVTNYVWRKKAEMQTGRKFSSESVLNWKDFHLICAKNLFGRNLLKNHSGENGLMHWIFLEDDFELLNNGYNDSSDDNIDGRSSSEESDSESTIEIDGEVTDEGDNDNDNMNESDKFSEMSDSESDIDRNIVVDVPIRGANDSDDENESLHSDRGNENASVNEHLFNFIDIDSENENHSNSDSDTDSDSDSDSDTNSNIGNDNGNSDEDFLIDDDHRNYMSSWIVECPPIGSPSLPLEAEHGYRNHCFVTNYHDCYKEQVINLIKEGFSINILDEMQPPFEACFNQNIFNCLFKLIFIWIFWKFQISEWYCSRVDCPALYNMRVRLLNQSNETLDEFVFRDILEGPRQNIWFNVSVFNS